MSLSRAFTIVELLVVIAVIAILAALLFPVFVYAKGASTKASCLSNVRQIATGVLLYTEGEEGRFPPAYEGDTDDAAHLKTWLGALRPYLVAPRCPALPRSTKVPSDLDSGYCMNSRLNDVTVVGGRFAPSGKVDTSLPSTSRIVLINECSVSFIACSSFEGDFYFLDSAASEYKDLAGTGDAAGRRHGGGSNYAFVDGHARWHRPEEFKRNDASAPRFRLDDP